MDGRKENHGAEGRGAHREGSAGEQGGESGALEKGRAAQSRGEACEGCRQSSPCIRLAAQSTAARGAGSCRSLNIPTAVTKPPVPPTQPCCELSPTYLEGEKGVGGTLLV